jgi:hypothetical protein
LFGNAAVDLVHEGVWGHMVSYELGRIGRVPLSAVAGRTRQIPPTHPLLRCARRIGVSFGDAG